MSPSAKPVPTSIAVQIREAREAAPLTQTGLAKLAGVTQHAVSDLEMGYETKLSTLIKIATALHLAGASALRIEENMSPPVEKPWNEARRARDQKKSTSDLV